MFISALTLIPIIWLIIALAVLKLPGHISCMIALGIAAVMSITLWNMPVIDCATSALEGFASALWPIVLVIFAALFTYDLTLRTGAMDIIKKLLGSVSNDKRIIILLIGWCFGGFIEGMAGFGTAVAIPAGMLAGMGFEPLTAVVICLIANAFPTSFGSVGIPTLTLANVTGLDPVHLAYVTVVQMFPFMIVVPFLMVVAGCGGIKSLKGMVPVTLASAVTYVVPELIIAKFAGPELAVMAGGVVSLVVVLVMVKGRKPEDTPLEYDISDSLKASNPGKEAELTTFQAFSPYLFILVLLLVTSRLVPPVSGALSVFSSSFKISTSPDAGMTSFAWVNTPGIWIFIAAFASTAVQGKLGSGVIGEAFKATAKKLSKTTVTIMCVLGVAKIMIYSGMISDMANFFVTLTGQYYTFVSPIIAAIGAFVTGSGTNTEVLLGRLQSEAAAAIGVNPFWLSAANSSGAGLGKIISPQCMATGLAAVNMSGQDSKLLSMIIKWMLIQLVFVCLWVGLFAAPLGNILLG